MDIELKTIRSREFEVDVSHFKVSSPKGTVLVFPGAGYSFMGPGLSRVETLICLVK